MAIDLDKITDAIKSAITTAVIYKFGIAVAASIYWFCATHRIIPDAAEWEIRLSAGIFILFATLWVANVISVAFEFFQPREHLAFYLNSRKEKSLIHKYIANMTPKEKEIIGYLLSKNQKIFIGASDGGYAMPLISQRIARMALQPNQYFDTENTPFAIPDHIWVVLVEQRDKFPIYIDDNQIHEPWRIGLYDRL